MLVHDGCQRTCDSSSQTELRILRYELSDYEGDVINRTSGKLRGVPHVDDRRVLNGIFWELRSGAPCRDLKEAKP